MNIGIILLSGAIVVAGRWTQGKGLDVPSVIALFFLAVMIAGLSEIDNDLGRAFALLMLIAVTYAYGRDIADAFRKATSS